MLRLIISIFAVVLVTTPIQAQLRYAWGDLDGNLITQTTINGLGATTTLRLYVQDQSAGATIFNSQGGLGSASVRVTGSIGNVSILTGSPNDGVGGWEFGTSNGSNPPENIALHAFNMTTGQLPDATGRILLGTMTIRGDTAGMFSITAADPHPFHLGDVTLFANGQSLDPLTPANLSVVTVIPEPTGVFLIAGLALFFGWRRCRSAVVGGAKV